MGNQNDQGEKQSGPDDQCLWTGRTVGRNLVLYEKRDHTGDVDTNKIEQKQTYRSSSKRPVVFFGR